MTTPTDHNYPSGQPYSPPPPWVTPTEPKRKSWFARHKILTILGAVFALIVIIGVASGGSDGGGKSLAPAVSAKAPAPLPPEQSAANSAATEPATPVVPTAKDFKLTIKTLSKQCFGEAGCNVTYRVSLDYVGAGTLAGDSSYEVTYQVRGDESGPQMDTITTHGMQYDEPMEGIASTPSSGTKLTIKVTGVEDVS